MKLPVLTEQKIENIMFQSLHSLVAPIYLDNNATTRVDEDAVVAMMRVMENDYGNPSALHQHGIEAHLLLTEARKNVAGFIGCKETEIIFTSCGTEAINAVIESIIQSNVEKHRSYHFITCKTEHNAVLNKLEAVSQRGRYDYGCAISYLDVDNKGHFNIRQLDEFLDTHAYNSLVSLMAANNETGTIHDNLFEAIQLAHKYGALFHVDAVQIAGKLPLKPYIDAGVDFLTISGHKFHAPKGIGALYVRSNTPFYPILFGGNQEYGSRAGTENMPAIMGMSVVAKKMPCFDDKIKFLHDLFIKLLTENVPSCIINGGGIPGTINVGFKYVHREAMVIKLSESGVYASIGSACTSGIEPSHVLKAMNVPQEYIHGSVRFSLSKYTTENEIKRAIEIIVKVYNELRSLSLGIIS